jgi:hypothetical protein
MTFHNGTDGHHVLRLVENGIWSADKGAEVIRALLRDERVELPPVVVNEVYCGGDARIAALEAERDEEHADRVKADFRCGELEARMFDVRAKLEALESERDALAAAMDVVSVDGYDGSIEERMTIRAILAARDARMQREGALEALRGLPECRLVDTGRGENRHAPWNVYAMWNAYRDVVLAAIAALESQAGEEGQNG